MELASATPWSQIFPDDWLVDGVRDDSSKTRRRRAMEEANGQDWAALLERIKRGDQEAERELVERLWPRVAGRIAGLCPRREEVEDLAQEVFLKIFSRLNQYRGGCFEAWVDIVARRVCYDALRKQRVRPEWRFSDLNDFEAGGIVDAGSSGPGDDAGEILAKLFSRLPAELAWLLTRVELEEASIGEVSREMGWTEVAGRLRLMRARRRLKKLYDEWEEGTIYP